MHLGDGRPCGSGLRHHAGLPRLFRSSQPITTAVSLKVAPTSIKFKKTVKATGTVTPAADLAGIKVALKAEIKVGTAWKAAKTGRRP